ncbi:hypothetical protein MRX96_031778 [Rhipicephalus microplus]
MHVVSARFSAAEPANVAAEMLELPVLDDSAGKRASEECGSSERGPPVATPSFYKDKTAGSGQSSRADSEPRRLSFLAKLHRARTANSRLVPPAANTFRPAPQRRSIRFRRTTSSQLQVITEVLHRVEIQAPLVPLRTKVPFSGEGETLHSASAKRNDTNGMLDGETQPTEPTTGIIRRSGSMERFCSRLHLSEGCPVPVERGAPSHVHFEHPLPRSPFAIMKHTSKSRSEFHATIPSDVDGSRTGWDQ